MTKETNSDALSCGCPTVGMKQRAKSLGWLVAATALYLVTVYALKHNPQWNPRWRVAVTLTPLIPGIFYLSSLLRCFRAMDELQRRIQIEACIFALAGTIVVNTVVNVLDANGVGFAAYPNGLEIGGAYMSVFILWSIGVTVSKLRYR